MGEWRDYEGEVYPYFDDSAEAGIECPCGAQLYVHFFSSRPTSCPNCGREYRAEASVRVFYRERPEPYRFSSDTLDHTQVYAHGDDAPPPGRERSVRDGN